jgi:predicted nucleic acid-binding protein
MRVFLDANVLFSASNAGSNIARLIDLLLTTGEAVTSELACEEARRNIALKRPTWAEEFEKLNGRVEIARSVVFTLPVALDEKDVPILCTAIRAKCDYLATGDKRVFGHLYGISVSGVTIISLLRLAEILCKAKSGS